MPQGTVSTYDQNIGHGLVETSSGRFPVREEDMAPDARVEGARVQFDVERDQPRDRAVNVVLIEGTHANPGHRRFGDNQQ